MQLTPEQLDAIQQGVPIRFTEGELSLVILRADIYERLQTLALDDIAVTTSETVDEIMAEDKAPDPFAGELEPKYPPPAGTSDSKGATDG